MSVHLSSNEGTRYADAGDSFRRMYRADILPALRTMTDTSARGLIVCFAYMLALLAYLFKSMG